MAGSKERLLRRQQYLEENGRELGEDQTQSAVGQE